ncbi:MarR family winged helix-turn-helix transcriptional regulator [Haloechinothrix sp. LS1_15]|uniref:MarR family winged helix-turn-helix transcriptional regulator n=1 Tax=Haloechinothrix sp. LS1_15 TaxID=2652248 RepID=UPI002945A67C|nr:MarR family winged helix-turn-helix transcriptional regulator [Haloechinothrix sp. LS1_15]MDV6013783.1 winged helix-turn-helix transcriptional regulator [Haloechinothrix sp. LS1_15]
MNQTSLVPGSIAEHTGCLLIKLGQVVFRLVEADLSRLGLRVRHYSILQALADQGSMTQLALGGYLRIDPATMVSSLDDLEHRTLATRVRDPQDRRRHVVELTSAGRRMLARVNGALEDLDTRLLHDLAADERAALHRSLRVLAEGPTLPAALDADRETAPGRVT